MLLDRKDRKRVKDALAERVNLMEIGEEHRYCLQSPLYECIFNPEIEPVTCLFCMRRRKE